MIETFKDRTTGEIFQNQTVLCEFYVFWREDMLREQDKAPNVVCVLTGDWSGIRLADDKQRIRIEPIRFILPEGNEGRTLEDYLAAEVELVETDNADAFEPVEVGPDAGLGYVIAHPVPPDTDAGFFRGILETRLKLVDGDLAGRALVATGRERRCNGKGRKEEECYSFHVKMICAGQLSGTKIYIPMREGISLSSIQMTESLILPSILKKT